MHSTARHTPAATETQRKCTVHALGTSAYRLIMGAYGYLWIPPRRLYAPGLRRLSRVCVCVWPRDSRALHKEVPRCFRVTHSAKSRAFPYFWRRSYRPRGLFDMYIACVCVCVGAAYGTDHT